MEVYFRFDDVDIAAKYVETFSASDDDLSSENSGRTLDGKMHKYSICAKETYDIAFVPLSWNMVSKIMNAVRNKNKIAFTYPSPLVANTLTTKNFYIQARTAAVAKVEANTVKWEGLAFKLAEI